MGASGSSAERGLPAARGPVSIPSRWGIRSKRVSMALASCAARSRRPCEATNRILNNNDNKDKRRRQETQEGEATIASTTTPEVAGAAQRVGCDRRVIFGLQFAHTTPNTHDHGRR